MTAALFTNAALDRIRAGASASDLGWTDTFYRRICRDHGIEPTPDRKPAPVDPEPAITTAPDGRCIFDWQTGEITRGNVAVTLPRRQSQLLRLLVSMNSRDTLVSGAELSARMSTKTNNLSDIAGSLRAVLRRLRIDLQSQKGPGGGYCLRDEATGEPARIETAP